MNPIYNVDSYKFSHYLQYPPGTTRVYSYVEPRKGAYSEALFFGLQAWVKRHLVDGRPMSMRDIDEAEEFCAEHGEPFNRSGFELIAREHGGRWPVLIRAVPEGSVVPISNVLVDVVNTDPRLPWVTSFLETAIVRAVWYPTTVATRALNIKRAIAAALAETADDDAMLGIDFKLNDFGARGASSLETAEVGGMAHLAVFRGTDNVAAVVAARKLYNERMAGNSIPAAEHSTMTSWGGEVGEVAAMKNMLRQFARPGALVAVVSDSYDLMRAVREYWGDLLFDEVQSSGACVVVRPDSGDPVKTPVDVIEALMDRVGFEVNSRGYKMLPKFFRVIQGDGVDESSIKEILSHMRNRGISADNIAFGMGGAGLQRLDRDTMSFAMKCAAIEVDGEWRDVFKRPATDATKASKKGRLELLRRGREYVTTRTDEPRAWRDDEVLALEPVYADGKLLRDQTLADVRSRAASSLNS